MSRLRDWPIAVRSVDISRPLTDFSGLSSYARVRAYVRDGERLLGAVEIRSAGADRISAERLGDAIAAQLAHTIVQARVRRALVTSANGDATEPLTVSIIVPTLGRLDDLRRCLASLVSQRTRHTIEIIVVDNRPSDGSARRMVQAEFPHIRVVDEPRAGLSYARNAGIRHASGEIIVATDDDVAAPESWIETLMAPFERPEVMAVTGNVLPLELETEAQCRFEAYGGLGKGFVRLEADSAWFKAHRLAVPTWNLGATANAAFRADVFRHPSIGLLDEALGAGTPTGCSEDTDLFYRILKAGYTLIYEPSAFVSHRHRTTMKSLRTQIYAYSKGHVAYHLSTWLREGDRRAWFRLLYSLPKAYVRRAWQRLAGDSDYPLSLIALEVAGNFAGPFALWQSRRRVKQLGRSESVAAGSRDALARSRT